MIKTTVLLDNGEEITFTAADILQAAKFVEKQYYPYRAVHIAPVEEEALAHAVEGVAYG